MTMNRSELHRVKKTMLKVLICSIALLVQTNLYAFVDPNTYHWEGQQQFFEGWYFKVSDPDTGKSFLFIYAVFNPDGESPESCGFMMAGNNSPGYAGFIYQQFPVEQFSSSYEQFDTRVSEENQARGDRDTLHARGSATDGEDICTWSIDFEVAERWDNTMGWMAGLPNLQTYWHVGAMKARATGWIEWNGELFEFEDIIGYQEKNWGDEFPESWYWLQANNFDDPKACCLSVGAASMPLGAAVFPACGIGLIYDDRLYTFSFPQQPAFIRPEIAPGSWAITAVKGRHKIVIEASCDPAYLLNLVNPTEQGIKRWTWEAINGQVRFQLYEKWGLRWFMIADATSNLAGTEFGGKKWLGWNDGLPD